jgi:hypothetical protein
MESGYTRAREKDAEARAKLKPLEPGERPVPVLIAALIAAAIAAANIVLFALGTEVGGDEPSPFGVIAFSGLMLAAAAGMWRGRYWAVLGFQALLAVSIMVACLSLATASNWAAVALCVGIIVPGGFLFWKLIRAMARLQMPERPTS